MKRRRRKRSVSIGAILLALALGWLTGWLAWWVITHPDVAAEARHVGG